MAGKNILDSNWYERLIAITRQTGETYERLMPPIGELSTKREEFESSSHRDTPNLIATHLDVGQIEKLLDGLLDLHDDIRSDELNVDIQHAYLSRIDELIENHHMLIASATNDMQAFAAANRNVYGKPDTSVFGAICQSIRGQALDDYNAESPTLSPLAEQVLRHIPDVEGDPGLLLPDLPVFGTVKDLHHTPGGYYDSLYGPGGLPSEPLIGQEAGDLICQKILKRLGTDYTLGFADNGLWSVLPSIKRVIRPPNYELTREEFIGIVNHEIGSHLLETINGGRQPLRLLTSALGGMDRFELSNEGRALLREQIVYGTPLEYSRLPFWQYCMAIHLAITLATGAHSHQYAFPEIYRVMAVLYAYWNELLMPDSLPEAAHDMAWHLTVRALKGTDGLGDAYRKDIVYVEGNLKCWNIAESSPELILLGDIGKFNIADAEHLRILRELDILETE